MPKVLIAAASGRVARRVTAALCALGDERDVRAGIDRYRAAGATNPLVSAVVGSDFTATLHAAAADDAAVS